MEYQDLASPTHGLNPETEEVALPQKAELKRRLVTVDDGLGNVCYRRDSVDTPMGNDKQHQVPLAEPVKDIPLLAERSRREKEQQSFFRRRCMVDSIWIVLALLGALASVLGFLIDEVIIGLQALLGEWMSLSTSFAGGWCLWILWKVPLVLLAVLVTRGSPAAAGSGIPEMKAILAGFPIPNYLSFRTLIVKVFGLAFALASGLGVGKEGPFIHICGIIANQLLSLKCFRSVNKSTTLRNQVMAAAVGVGVSATFGAPVGGVLFGIEVTSTYYSVASYWKAIFTAIVGTVVFGQLATMGHDTAFNLFWTDFESAPYKAYEMWLFVLLAVICGLASSLFVRFRKLVLVIRQRYQVRFFGRGPFMVSTAVALICGIWEFPFGCPMMLPLRKAANDLFHSSDLWDKDLSCNWNEPIPMFASVCMFLILRFLFTCIIMTLPIPCGIITPVFAVGAGIGRLYGEILHLIEPEITAGGYAVVGAASFTAAVTERSGTISIAVIVFELTAQLSYMHPILLGVVIARKFGSIFGVSVYDSIADKQGLPFMPFLNRQKSYLREAWEVMQPIDRNRMCPRLIKRDDIPPFLQWDHEATTVPVVDSLANSFFLGCVSVPMLLELYNDRKLWHLPAISSDGPREEEDEEAGEVAVEEGAAEVTTITEQPQQQKSSPLTVAIPSEEKSPLKVDPIVIDLVERNVMSLKSLRVPHTTPLNDVIAFFSLHRCGRVFVTTGHAVVGYIDLADLQKHSVDGLL